MRGTPATGLALLVVALAGAGLIVVGLYAWDTRARAAETALRPVPVAPLAVAPVTPTAPAVQAVAAVNASPPAPGTDSSAGQPVFAKLCSGCHPGASAGVGPSLHGPAFDQRYPDDAAISSVVRIGRGGMPAFPVGLVSDADLANVIAYVRTLSGVAVSASPSATSAPAALSQQQLSQIQPGLSGYMLEAAKRLGRAWFAAQAGAWDESAFEVREAKDVLHRGGLKSSTARQQALEGVNAAFLDPLIEAAQAADQAPFESAYRNALQGCNACHAAQVYSATGRSFGFIHVQVPTSSIWDVYDYSNSNSISQGR